MARTKQTKPLPRSTLHSKYFTDHAGSQALRARWARPGPYWDVPEDFQKNPVFAFQVYSTIPLDLDESSSKRARPDDNSESTAAESNLHALVKFLGGAVTGERPPPVYEVYPEQRDCFACIAHQQKEIVHRKERASNPVTLLIPKIVLDPDSDNGPKTGFLIVIFSERFKSSDRFVPNDDPGLMWVRFKRGDQWDLEASFTKVLNSRIQFIECGPFQSLYQSSYSRRPIDCDLDEDASDVIEPLSKYADLGLDDADVSLCTPNPSTARLHLEEAAKQLSLENTMIKQVRGSFVISTCAANKEPDLRYVIYVAFALDGHSSPSLEQVAKASTSSITSRLAAGKTVYFDFRKPTDFSRGVILDDYERHLTDQPDDYIGALVDISDNDDTFAYSARIHYGGQDLSVANNVPDDGFTSYHSFIVIITDPAIEADGSLEFLLAGGRSGTRDEGIYVETILKKSSTIDTSVKTLAMDLVQ